MSEALATQCPKCQSTKLKSIRFGDQIATFMFWAVIAGILLLLGHSFGLWGFVYFQIGGALVVAVSLFGLVVGVVRFCTHHPVSLVCMACGARWQNRNLP